MAHIIMLITGILILLFTVYDLLYTTMVPKGAGPVTNRVTDVMYQLIYHVCGGHGRHWILNYSGMTIMISILLVWLALIWLGNTLILLSEHESILNSISRTPTTVIEKLYFTGYTISTLGNGEYLPNGPVWQMYVTFLSFSGLVLITISLSYIIPVLSADLEKRSLAIYISSLGETPQDIILNAWSRENGLSGLANHLNTVNQQILSHGQKHLAYPVLHYYHSTNTRESAPINIVNLDEALTILLLYVPKDIRPLDSDLILLRKSINGYLHTLNETFIDAQGDPLPLPKIDKLRDSGVPLQEVMHNDDFWDRLSHRRSLLNGLLIHDGWNIKDLFQSEQNIDFHDPLVTKK